MIDRHHLIECILWPNGDGTLRKIVNTGKRLDELGVYKDYKLTIPIEHRIHMIMHAEFRKGTEYELSGERNGMYGKHLSDSHKNAISESCTGKKNGMYGRDVSREKAPSWKGDKVGVQGAYVRAKKLYKSGQITEEEFQPYRDAWAEDQRLYRMKRDR